MNENLELKSISEILKYGFFIPSYQRGYRWDNRQVEDLLEDIYDFAQKKERGKLKLKEFYCLQPIAVKKLDTEYEVIDGQQRLTTLLILMKYLESKIKDDFYIDKFYSIRYQTRDEEGKSSQDFIKNITSITSIEKENIDFYYMSNTYITIQNWFTSNKINKGDFLNVLLKSDIEYIDDVKIDNANNIRIIWYEIDSKNEIDVFTRLNIGKIPLTNAELIKALFLIHMKKENENEKILLASQWDDIEYKLQEKEFFSFIYSGEFIQPTKIEYIFDIIAKSKNLTIENLKKDDNKYSFYIFNELIKGEKDAKVLWNEVKTYFRIFNELHINNIYYHLVGFLTHTGTSIKTIIDIFRAKEKEEFRKELVKLITNTINLKDKVFKSAKNVASDKELNYNNTKDYTIITNILFLFNVVSTMKSGYARYPFDKHKSEKWSLEHIHAQKSEDIVKDDERRELCISQLDYINDELKLKVNKLMNNEKIDSEVFNQLQNEIFKAFSDDSSVHTIDNLALLGKDANSSLNNSIFPAKRDKIKRLDKDGLFIPIGTKNVFLKYYSDNVKDGIIWNKNDRKAYLKAIEDTLVEYIGDNKYE